MSKARCAGPRCVGRAEEGARPREAVPYGRYRQRPPTGLRAQSKGCPHRQNSRGGGKGSTGTGKAPLRGTGRAAAPGAAAAARKAKGRWSKGSRTAAFRAPVPGGRQFEDRRDGVRQFLVQDTSSWRSTPASPISSRWCRQHALRGYTIPAPDASRNPPARARGFMRDNCGIIPT